MTVPALAVVTPPKNGDSSRSKSNFRAPARGRPRRAPRVAELPTVSVASLCSLASNLASNQLLRHVLQLGTPVADTSLEYCGYTNRTVTSPLTLSQNCPCDHRRGVLLPSPKLLREVSLAELAAAAGFSRETGVVGCVLGDDGHRLVLFREPKAGAPQL